MQATESTERAQRIITPILCEQLGLTADQVTTDQSLIAEAPTVWIPSSS